MHCKGKKNSFGGRKSSFKAHQGFKHVPLNDPDGTRGGSPNNPSLMNPNQMAQNRMLNSAVNASSSSQGTGGTGDNRTLAGAAVGLGGAYLLYKGIKGLAGKIKESPRFQGSVLGTSNEPRLAAKADRYKQRMDNRMRRRATNKDGSLKAGYVQFPDGRIERKLSSVPDEMPTKTVKKIDVSETPKSEMEKATPPPPPDKPFKKTRAQRREDRKNEKRLKGFEKEGKKEGKRILKEIDKEAKQKEKDKKKRIKGYKKELKNEAKLQKRLDDFDAGKGPDFRRVQRLKKKSFKEGKREGKKILKEIDKKKNKTAAAGLLAAAAPVLKKAAVSAVANVAAKKLMPEKQAKDGFLAYIRALPSGSRIVRKIRTDFSKTNVKNTNLKPMEETVKKLTTPKVKARF